MKVGLSEFVHRLADWSLEFGVWNLELRISTLPGLPSVAWNLELAVFLSAKLFIG
jgi:hypothetical protein